MSESAGSNLKGLTQSADKIKFDSLPAASVVALDILGQGATAELSRVSSDLQTTPPPIAIFVANPSDLLMFRAGSDPSSILHGTEIIYPLFDESQQLRASVIMYKSGSSWKRGISGGTGLLGEFVKQIVESALISNVSYTRYFAVQIPTISQYYVAYEDEETLWMIPIQSDARYNIEMGQLYNGPSLLARLGLEIGKKPAML